MLALALFSVKKRYYEKEIMFSLLQKKVQFIGIENFNNLCMPLFNKVMFKLLRISTHFCYGFPTPPIFFLIYENRFRVHVFRTLLLKLLRYISGERGNSYN